MHQLPASAGPAPASRRSAGWARDRLRAGWPGPLRLPLPLVIILLVAAALRLLYIGAPLLDAHRWRQVDTAQMARFMYEDGFNLLWPQVNWGGERGYVESEFPLLPALTAVLYHVLGPDEMWGRLIVVAFSLGIVGLVYVLGREVLGRSAGLAAAALVAVSPAAVFYGRAVMPDTLMVFFSIAAIVGMYRHLETGSRWWLVICGASFGLAVLVKLPGVIVAAPLAALLWTHRRVPAARRPQVLAALAVPLLVAAAWYWHAFGIYRDTGLTFGVFGTTKTYPREVADAVWTEAFPKWSTRELLTTRSFYQTMLSRLYFLHLTPPGFVLAAVGALLWRRHAARLLPDAWLAAMLAFLFAAGWGHMGHDYYQLPFVPICALYFGAAAWPVFDAKWIARALGPGRGWRLAMAGVLAGVALMGIWFSGVIERHFRPASLDTRMLEAGSAIDRAVEDGALLVVVDDYGVNSPMLLYLAHARGWSLSLETVSAHIVRGLQARGARYFATTRWSRVERAQPDLAQFLDSRRRVPLDAAPADTALFDLLTPRREP